MDKEIKHSGELIPLIKNDGTVGPLITKMVRAYRTVHGILYKVARALSLRIE